MRPSSRKIFENAICVAILALTALLAHLPLLTQDSLPLELESIFFSPPWEEARPAGLEPVGDSSVVLDASRIYPSRKFLHDTMAKHDSLLWRSSEGLGAPFFALWRTRCLSPFSLPFYVFDLRVALLLSALLKLMVAGWCAFYAARRLAFPPAMALMVALAFQLSGPVYLWSGRPLSDVVPWLPLLLICSERLALGQFRAWALTAVTLGVMGLGGDPETLAASVLFSLLYLVARRFRDPANSQLARPLGALALGVTAGLALIAVQVLPYLEYLTQSAPTVNTAHTLLSAKDLLVFFAPTFLDPSRADAASVIRLLHVGVLQVFLLALWLAIRRFLTRALRRRMEALLISALLLALLAYVVTPLLATVPCLSQMQPQHFLVALPLAFAFVAAASVEEWNELNPDQCKATLARLVIFVPVVWGAAAAAAVVHGANAGANAGLWPGVWSLVAAAVVILVMLGLTLFRPSVPVAGYVLCAVTFALQWAAFQGHVPHTPRAGVFPETPMIQSLQAAKSRIGGSETLKQWPLSGNGIEQVFTPGGTLLKRYEQFMARVDDDPLLLRRTGARALLLTKEDVQGAFAAVRPVLHIQEVYPSGAVLFLDLDTIPRARMAYAGQNTETISADTVRNDTTPVIPGITLPAAYDGPVAQPEILAGETNTHIEVAIPKTRRGVLILADAWYPGWTATVDGELREIVPVDGFFRGVEVGEGEHKVVFSYEPLSLKIGLAISAAALVIVLANLRHFLPRRRSAWDV